VIALRLALNELRRLTAGRLPRIAVVGVVIVPLLYGGFYLYANWDPYGNLDKIPVALVVADQGANVDGKVQRIGADVAAELLKQHTFDWHEVSAAQADAGVRDGTYTFAVSLPAGFSSALASPGTFDAKQGMLILTTNDANSYTGSSIGTKVVDQIRRTVAAKAGAAAAERLLAGFAVIQEKTAQAADGAQKLATGSAAAHDGAGTLASGNATLASGIGKLRDGSGELENGAGQLSDGAGRLATGLGTARDKTRDLPAQTARLASGARQVANGNAQLAAKANVVAGAAQDFTNAVDGSKEALRTALKAIDLCPKAGTSPCRISDPDIENALAALDQLKPVRQKVDQANADVQAAAGQVNQLAAGSRQVADGAGQLAAATPQLTAGIASAASGAGQLATGADRLRDGAATLHGKLGEAATGATKLADGSAKLRDGTAQLASGSGTLSEALAKAAGQIPHPDEPTRKATARVIGDPVAVRSVGQATAQTYGAGLAPFFLGLALWVGAFTLFMLIRPLSRRALAAGQRAGVVALGGWLPAAVMGGAQAILLFGFAVTLIGVRPAHPVGTLAFMLLTGLAFTAVVHALNALFGPAGKFLALVLLVLQLTTAGGTFPWQTTPDPLHPLHLLLPLSYVVDGLRHLLYGGGLSGVGTDVAVLAGYLALGLALSTLASHRHRIWTGSRLKPELVL
jgi:putative membrane protein